METLPMLTIEVQFRPDRTSLWNATEALALRARQRCPRVVIRLGPLAVETHERMNPVGLAALIDQLRSALPL